MKSIFRGKFGKILIGITFPFLLVFFGDLKGQGDEVPDKILKKTMKLNDGKVLFNPYVAPAYNPELKFVINVGALISFKIPPDTLHRASSVQITGTIGSTGSLAFVVPATVYFLDDRLRIENTFNFRDMPDNYWGVGYETIINTEKSDSTTAYRRRWVQFNPRILYGLYGIMDHFYGGINIDFNYTKGSEASEGVAMDPNYIKFNDRPFNGGVGLMLRYDNRDFPQNAWDGLLLEVAGTFYGKYLWGDNNYQVLQVDYRQYRQLNRKGQVLAWYSKLRLGFGEQPYGEMSQLGTPTDLRGYTWGRFRDKSLFFFLAEYRHTFRKKDGSGLSRFGFVTWIGTGTIFDVTASVNEINEWLRNLGIGFRYELQPRLNIRMDIGMGEDTTGVYFSFTEAF